MQVVYGSSTETIYDVHSDHLDTPRMLTDNAGVPSWRASYQAFGKAYLSSDPDGSVVTTTPSIAAQAGSLALDHGLRAYDAVHLATALTLQDRAPSSDAANDLALVSGDRDLLEAAHHAGLTVVRTSARG